jgi:hypothetical protein
MTLTCSKSNKQLTKKKKLELFTLFFLYNIEGELVVVGDNTHKDEQQRTLRKNREIYE